MQTNWYGFKFHLNSLRLRQNDCPFCIQHFLMHFIKWKSLNFNWNFNEVCCWMCSWQYTSIGSYNGLAPRRRQAIIWSNDGLVYWRIYASLGLNGTEQNVRYCNNDIFKCHFLRKHLNFDPIFSGFFFCQGSSWQQALTGLDKGLVPNKGEKPLPELMTIRASIQY